MSIYDVLGSGLAANKLWMDASANNVTNMNTTRTADGTPYRRQSVLFEAKEASFETFMEEQAGGGVRAAQVVEDTQENLVYNPEHPDASEEGYVRMPAINLAAEMTNLMMAQRAYEAGVSTLTAMKETNAKTLEIGKG